MVCDNYKVFNDLPAYLQKRIRVEADHWMWVGNVSPTGYGRMWGADHPWLAHRLVWSVLRGDPPPVLHHVCRVRRCVNPAHLTPIEPGEHTRLHHFSEVCSEGHPFTSENTYVRRDGRGRQCRICKARRQRAVHAKDPQGANRERTERRRRARAA